MATTDSAYSRLVDPCRYNADGLELSYTPLSHLSRLDWFNIARCARLRMTANAGSITRWRGERRSFYTALQMVDADSVTMLD